MIIGQRRGNIISPYVCLYFYELGSVNVIGVRQCHYYGRPVLNRQNIRPIFSSCGFFLLSFFSPILSRRRLDVYHTSTHGVVVCDIAIFVLKRDVKLQLTN